MIEFPSTSVIIPTRNRAALVRRAIWSVLAQTQPPDEIIVVDDASTDDTAACLQSFGARIRPVFLERNEGAPTARNIGVSRSRGAMLAFLDSDDEWLPEKLERQHRILTSMPTAGACFTAVEVLRQGKCAVRPLATRAPSLADLCSRNVVGSTSTAVVRREAFERAGGFDRSLPASQDWDLWLRLRRAHDLVGIDEPLVRYRYHDDQISGDPRAVFLGLRAFYEKHEGDLHRHLTRSQLGAWQENIGRLAVLAGDKAAARHYLSLALGSGHRPARMQLLRAALVAGPTLRWLALARRRWRAR